MSQTVGPHLDLHDDHGYLRLGAFVNWHLRFPGLFPSGESMNVEQKAEALLGHFSELERKPKAPKGTPNRTQANLMALEIVTHYQRRDQAMPLVVERLLAKALGFDPEDMPDPRDHYIEAPKRSKSGSKRDLALWIEAEYRAEHGERKSENSVAKAVGVERATVRNWRKDPEYWYGVKVLAAGLKQEPAPPPWE
jgi:hypothetical protein